MTTSSGPLPLNSHQQHTTNAIFQHPASHNIEWRDVFSLLNAVGSVTEHGGKVTVTIGSETSFFDVPSGKDIDMDTVVGLRRVLSAAGYHAQ